MIHRQSDLTSAVSRQTKDRSTIVSGREWLVLVALIASGAGLRLLFRDLPNFAPVAALALFAGYYFRSIVVAIVVPVAVMALSDWFMGGYDWQLMALVYGMLAFPVLLRTPLRRLFRFGRPGFAGTALPLVGLVGCSLLSSILFFIVTNFGVWAWFGFGAYEPTLTGLWHCYLAAIPFFRYTVAGDLTFSIVLFGSYAMAHALSTARVLAQQAA